ncbi:hypothetical protein FH972_020935 [Carpinus fangiana]|uniref:Uncharacterized protein n=1 Tax=Carpinus fangiana TaxID=176857 RepID=A0A5N6RZ79_9ROSI|nr:hypothetical protein FH972_020935 [Carpinus fangiana]
MAEGDEDGQEPIAAAREVETATYAGNQIGPTVGKLEEGKMVDSHVSNEGPGSESLGLVAVSPPVHNIIVQSILLHNIIVQSILENCAIVVSHYNERERERVSSHWWSMNPLAGGPRSEVKRAAEMEGRGSVMEMG